MATNVIPTGYAFSYRGRGAPTALALHRWITTISDSLKNRIAKHSYLKRDGSEKEPMGADDGVFKFRLAIVGPTCAQDYRAVASYLRQYPRGTLVHPLLGQIQVASEGVDGGEMDLASATNLITVGLTFGEDALNTAIAVDAQPAPATQQAKILTSATTLSNMTTTSAFTKAIKVISLVNTIVTKATTYAQLAIAAYQSRSLTQGLDVALLGVKSGLEAIITAVPLDSTIPTEADRARLIIAAEQTYGACLGMQASVVSVAQVAQPYTASGVTTVGAIASQLFGKDGASRIKDILALNRIPNPYAIPDGTKLKVPPRTSGST